MKQLLAAASSGWVLDVAFFAILVLATLFGTWRGFVKGVCKLAGTIFAIFVAITFSNAFKNTLEDWFGMTSAIAEGFGGTDAAVTAASWISVAIAAIALFLIVKILSWLLGSVGSKLVKQFAPLRIVDRILGAVLGLAKGLFLVFLLLTICYWIPADGLHAYISESSVVGAIFRWEWFQWAAEFNFLK